MPSKSPAQHRLMEAVAHDPGFAKKVGIKQSVGRDFANADKAHKYLGLKTDAEKKKKVNRAKK